MSREVIHGTTVIGMDIKKYNHAITKIERLERELKDARARNEVQNKYWHDIATDRNTYLIEKQILEKRVEELEAELYFCNRNKRVGEIVDGY